MTLTVTFDSNVLHRITQLACNGKFQQGDDESGTVIVTALNEGRIKGFFSQTYQSLEGIMRRKRSDFLGRTALVSSSFSPNKTTITLSIGIKHDRPPLPEEHNKALKAVLSLGCRALRGPARFVDGLTVPDPDGEFYIIETNDQMIAHREKANEVAAAIEARGVGRAIALGIGNRYNASAGYTEENPRLWLAGLGNATTKRDIKEVAKAVAEWADGDTMASHIGYGIDYFCTEDFARNSKGQSIFNAVNREWLSQTYGVKFATMKSLALLLSQ